MLALVMREQRLDKAGALAWLEQQGFLRGRGESPINPRKTRPHRIAAQSLKSGQQYQDA